MSAELMKNEYRIVQVQAFLAELARGNFEIKLTPSEKKDEMDAIMIGLDMVREEIKHAKIQFNNLFEFTADAVIIISGKTQKIVQSNEKTSEIFGYDSVDLLEISPVDLIADQGNERTIFLNALSEKKSLFETVIQCKSGEIRHVEINMQTISLEEGDYYQSFIRDITARKKSEARRNAIFRIAQELHKDHSIRSFSDLVREILGDIFPVESMYFSLFNHSENVLTRLYHYEENGESDFTARTRKFGNGLSEYIVRTGKPLLLHGEELLNFQESHGMEIYGKLAKSWVSVPLFGRDEVIGNFALQSFDRVDVFGDEDLEMLSVIGSQVGGFISRHQSEKRLIESERKYRLLLNNSPDATLLVDESGKIISTNNIAQGLFGYDEELFKQLDLNDLIPNPHTYAHNKHLKNFFTQSNSGRMPSRRRVFGKKKSGETFPVEISLSYIETENGRLAISAIRDVTAQVLAEEEIRKYERFFSVSLDLFCIASLEGYFIEVNPRFEQLLGYSSKELIDRSFLSLVHPDDVENTIKEMENLAKGKSTLKFINRYQVKDGGYKWFMWSASLDETSNMIFAVASDVTDLKLLEMELVENQKKLQLFFDMAPIGIARNDLKGGFVEVNQEFTRFTGYSSEEVKELSYWDLTPLEYEKDETIQLESLQRKGRYGPYSKEYVNKNGDRFPVLLNGVSLKDRNGEEFIWSVVQDITLEKRTELINQKVREIQNRFIVSKNTGNIFSLMLSALLEITKSTYGFIGETGANMYSSPLTIKAIKNLNWNDVETRLYETLQKSEIKCQSINGLFKEMLSHNNLFILNDSQKSTFYKNPPIGLNTMENFMGIPIFIQNKLIGVIGLANREKDYSEELVQDLSTFVTTCATMITSYYSELKHRRAEEENRMLANIVSMSSDAIMTVNTDGVITSWNTGAKDLFQFSNKEIVNQKALEVLSPSGNMETHAEVYEKTFRGISGQNIETQLLKKDKGVVSVSMSCFPTFNEKHEVIGMSAIVRDISKKKEIEKQRQKFTKDLEKKVSERTNELVEIQKELEASLEKEKELNELKSGFVATASHQFRTPMTIIQSNSEILEMIVAGADEELRERLERSTGRIMKEIQRMIGLMDDILILGKMNSGEQSVNKSNVNLIPFLEDIIEQFNMIHKDGKAVKFLHASDQINCFVDLKLLDHAVTNIISNAIKYSQGAPSTIVKVDLKKNTVLITVKDFGIGIPKEELTKIFGKFYRGSNTQEIKGTGLGLIIAKEYLELNGGKINIDSKENEGTTVKIEIPIAANG